jgi:hypothetical protein
MPACVLLHRMRHGGQERLGAVILQQHRVGFVLCDMDLLLLGLKLFQTPFCMIE